MLFSPKTLLYIAWVQAVIATAGSLFFSELMNLPPCVLCWYQRIAMYPLVVILAVGIALKDIKVAIYGLPFAVAGLVIAIYHNLLYYHLIPESIAPCAEGISCTTRQIEWWGFVTIPFLSLIAFAIMSSCLLLYWKQTKSTLS